MKNTGARPPLLKGDNNPARYRSAIGQHWLSGKPSNSKGYLWTLEQRQWHSKNKSLIGFKHSTESKLLMSKNQKKTWRNKSGGLHPKSKKVYCVSLDMIFDSITLAADFTKCSKGNITSCCQGKIASTKKLIFKYFKE